jgi:hypothetical protein
MMLLFLHFQQLDSFDYLPQTQRHMRGYDLSLKSGTLHATSKFLRLDMEWDRSKKYPSEYLIRVLGSRSGDTPPFESALKTNPINLGIPETSQCEFSLDQNGFGIFIFRAKGFLFLISLRREFVSDSKGFNGNTRTQSKDAVTQQVKEIAKKIQPEARDFVKSWKWQEKRIHFNFFRGSQS